MSRTLLLCSSSVEKFLAENEGGRPGGGFSPSDQGTRGGDGSEEGVLVARHFSGGSHSKASGFSTVREAGLGAGGRLAGTGFSRGVFGSGSRKKSRTRPTTFLKTLITLAICRETLSGEKEKGV
ncbi:MAG: hypothetical protein K1Y01_04260 [Vicinamibacteria bacterium]|nr:hypothetical protein [Vicinamibacteria bacterium]